MGIVLLTMAVGLDRLSALLPAEVTSQLGILPQQIARTPWYLTLVGAYERAMTIPFHVAMSLVVLRCFTRGQRRWLWVAVGLHALVDFTAPGMLSLLGWPVWVVEGYLTLWAAGSVWYIARAAGPLRAQEAPAAG